MYGDKAIERQRKMNEAVDFFMKFINADCDHIAVENPVGVMTSRYMKPTQYIQPYQFGHPNCKKTGLWLKGLPKLQPTNVVEIEYHTTSGGKKVDKWFHETGLVRPHYMRSRIRSKTFEGIADAMAEQWGVV